MPPTLWQIGGAIGAGGLGEHQQNLIQRFNLVFGEVIEQTITAISIAQKGLVLFVILNARYKVNVRKVILKVNEQAAKGHINIAVQVFHQDVNLG